MKSYFKNKNYFSFIVLIISVFYSLGLLAWGGRGHQTVCEAAIFLLKEKDLKAALQRQTYTLAHLCNLPDFSWRNINKKISHIGNPTHYIDADVLGLPIKNIPLDYKEIITKYSHQKNAVTNVEFKDFPKEFGSNWWRANQFYQLAIAAAKDANKIPPDKASENSDYEKDIYNFIVNLGLMGHFVGDNSQPMHLTSDYDGVKAGHKGIHLFYENDVTAALPYDLESKVIQEGQRLQKKSKKNKEVSFLYEKSLIEKMRALGEISYSEIPKLYSLDKTPSDRLHPEKVAKKFEPLIIQQLARSAILLAELWDEAYIEAGRPQLKYYKDRHYPADVEFVAPNYIDQ